MGQYIGEGLTKSRKLGILLSVSFVMGLLITVAEPDLAVLARQVSAVMDSTLLIVTVGAGVGICLLLGVLTSVFHGVQTPCRRVADDYLFAGLPDEFPVGRYHSWVVDAATLPAALECTAVSPEGQVMALRHRELDIRGLQFHPESVLTPDGAKIIANWLNH